jgi:hypothetical protein
MAITESKKRVSLTPCPKCRCMTYSIRESRAYFVCGKCKADKTLSDVYFAEATQKRKVQIR